MTLPLPAPEADLPTFFSEFFDGCADDEVKPILDCADIYWHSGKTAAYWFVVGMGGREDQKKE